MKKMIKNNRLFLMISLLVLSKINLNAMMDFQLEDAFRHDDLDAVQAAIAHGANVNA